MWLLATTLAVQDYMLTHRKKSSTFCEADLSMRETVHKPARKLLPQPGPSVEARGRPKLVDILGDLKLCQRGRFINEWSFL